MYELSNKIREYYRLRGLAWPNTWEAMGWVNTELAEAYELLLAQNPSWVRNNPARHTPFDSLKFAEELGDAIMMLMVAGMAEGVDPIEALLNKMERKRNE